MIAVRPQMISKIDDYAENTLRVPASALMTLAGKAVAVAVLRAKSTPCAVLILCGGGNNGGDGYAAGAVLLEKGYAVTAVDLFDKGQRSEAGQAALARYREQGGQVVCAPAAHLHDLLAKADVVVDALLGTGAVGALPSIALQVLRILAELPRRPYLLAVDVPLGVCAATGQVQPEAVPFDETVMLSYPKLGLYSHPARRFCGRMTNDHLCLPTEDIAARFQMKDHIMDDDQARDWLPPRWEDSHKGSYGTLAAFCGSEMYGGAALLACDGAHHTGVGLVQLYGVPSLLSLAVMHRPETVVCPIPSYAALTVAEAQALTARTAKATAVLVGCGCGRQEGLARLLRCLLEREGAPLILDADALNVLADNDKYGLLDVLKSGRRAVAMTPHPLELSRLMGTSVEMIAAHRLASAVQFACEYQVTLLLKGAGTVIASPDGSVTVNTSGSSALAKGGSGDVLAGAVASFAAQGAPLPQACALAAYLHGRAGELLARQDSDYGVLPSRLPRAMAQTIQGLSR